MPLRVLLCKLSCRNWSLTQMICHSLTSPFASKGGRFYLVGERITVWWFLFSEHPQGWMRPLQRLNCKTTNKCVLAWEIVAFRVENRKCSLSQPKRHRQKHTFEEITMSLFLCLASWWMSCFHDSWYHLSRNRGLVARKMSVAPIWFVTNQEGSDPTDKRKTWFPCVLSGQRDSIQRRFCRKTTFYSSRSVQMFLWNVPAFAKVEAEGPCSVTIKQGIVGVESISDICVDSLRSHVEDLPQAHGYQ